MDMPGEITESMGTRVVGDAAKTTSERPPPTKEHSRIEVRQTGKNSKWEMASIIQVAARKQLVFYDMDNAFEWLDLKAKVRLWNEGAARAPPHPRVALSTPIAPHGLTQFPPAPCRFSRWSGIQSTFWTRLSTKRRNTFRRMRIAWA